MNRTFFFFAALVVALSCATGWGNPLPRLECPSAVYDFGVVDAETPVSHTFQIRNTGDADLVIRKIHAPCGCTAFRLDNKILGPGQTLQIPVTLNLKGRRGFEEKTVFLETNDPLEPRFKLLLRGTVGSGIEIEPPMLTLRKDPKSTGVSGEVRVRDASGKPLSCLEAKSIEGKLEVSTTPLEDGGGFLLRATPSAGLAPGQHRDKIQIGLQGSTESSKTVEALILIPADLIAAPSVLRLDTRAAAPLSRTVIVRSPAGISFTVDSVEVPDPAMTTRIERMDANSTRVVVGNIHPRRELDGARVVLRLGGENSRTLEIPVVVQR